MRKDDRLGNATFCLANGAHPRTGCGARNGPCLADDRFYAYDMWTLNFSGTNPCAAVICRCMQTLPATNEQAVVFSQM
jgi:hypothetical protein